MPELTPEERERIYLEEKERFEARERLQREAEAKEKTNSGFEQVPKTDDDPYFAWRIAFLILTGGGYSLLCALYPPALGYLVPTNILIALVVFLYVNYWLSPKRKKNN